MTTTELDVEPGWSDLVMSLLRDHAPRPSRIWAFGSRVQGRAHRFSDLDLAIDAGRPLTIDDAAGLDYAFEESRLPWRVDLVDLATCSERFRREIESQAVLVLEIPAGADLIAASAGADR